MGKSPVGSFLSYQASFTGSNFSAKADLTAVAKNNIPVTNIAIYLRFPLSNEADMVIPRVLTDAEKSLLANLTANEDKFMPLRVAIVIKQAALNGKKSANTNLLSQVSN